MCDMDGETMREIVEDFLMGKRSIYEYGWEETNTSTSLEHYELTTAIRLIKSVIKYRQKRISAFDFLSSLRSYLILFKEPVMLAADLLECVQRYEGRFGIRLTSDQMAYAVMDLPIYLNTPLVESAFMYNLEENHTKKNPYFLGVSPYIYHLTDFQYFKSLEQKLAVTGALVTPLGYTSLIALSTGGGKSLVTQTVSYQENEGLTIVIVPTISLAIDQVRATEKNIKHNTENEVFCYYSGIKDEQVEHMLQCIESEQARLIFVSPEALIKNIRIKNVIKRANERKYLKNIIIDEAHIVIEWGAFFRTDYQCLEAWRKELYAENSDIRTFLLSATYEKTTVKNLKLMFSEEKWIEIRCDALRKEPRYVFVKAESYEDKRKKLLELVEKLPKPMILYVTSPYVAEELKELLQTKGYSNLVTFTGKTGSEEREQIINDWSKNEYDLIIATSAFGVGVDKSDVRTVLHYYIPENPNKYYQELGRGGRDGLPCLSVMCVCQEDMNQAFKRVDKVLSVDKIVGRWFSMLNSDLAERYLESVVIDTTIKPSYNMEEDTVEDFYEPDVNKINMNWNIYVLLLLRRYNFITILSMFYDKDRYYINVKINKDELLYENEDARSLISEIREKETQKALRDFRTMQNAVQHVGKQCWSEMFYDTYENVSEYCAGCENHAHRIYDLYNHFELVKRIDKPLLPCIEKHSVITKEINEMQVISNWTNQKVIKKLIDVGVNTIVLDEYSEKHFLEILELLPSRSKVNIMGAKELEVLIEHRDWYYVSGSILMIYGQETSKSQNKMILLSKKLIGLEGIQVIHLLDQNIYIREMDKDLEEIIDGPHFEGYIIEKMEE